MFNQWIKWTSLIEIELNIFGFMYALKIWMDWNNQFPFCYDESEKVKRLTGSNKGQLLQGHVPIFRPC